MLYAYPIVSWFYLLLPLLAVGGAVVVSRRRGTRRPLRLMLRTIVTGGALGLVVATLYVWVLNANVPPGQMLVAAYEGVAAMCVVSGVNWLVSEGVYRAMRRIPALRKSAGRWWALTLLSIARALLVAFVALPYLGSFLLLYRPKAPSPGDPLTLLDAPFETIRFRATDGTALQGWWIDAARGERTDGRAGTRWGRDTVLLCHGFDADKARHLFLARDLVANGYNVLAIDLRAHGRSGGQFTGFGGIESRDVLGAVRWLRANRAGNCHRILGLGESLGAVALIEAAADPGEDGQAIDAIAAYNPYDDLMGVVGEEADIHARPTVRWSFRHLVIPLASAQIGQNLSRLSPVHAASALWPRPILVIGNGASRGIGGRSAYDFYRDVLQPKYSYWREDADREALLHDTNAALTVRIFFDGERSIL